jgi:hypothetical protein
MAVLHLGIEFVFIVAKPREFQFEDIAACIDRLLAEKTALRTESFTLQKGYMEWEITDPAAKINFIALVWKELERELKFNFNIYLKPPYEPEPGAKFKGEDWQLDLAQQLFLKLKARLAVGGSSGVGEDIDLSSTETLDLGEFKGTLLIDRPRWELLQEFFQYVDKRPPWSERPLGEGGRSLVWSGWFGEPEATLSEPIVRLPWEMDPPRFDDSVGAQYDFLSVAGFGSLMTVTEAVSHTYRFVEEAKDLDVSLDLLPDGISLHMYAASTLNCIRINRGLMHFELDVLNIFEELLNLPLDEVVSLQNFLKLSLCWARVAYLKCTFGTFQIYLPRLNEHKNAKVLLFFPLGEDKFDYLGEAWQWNIIKRFFKAFDVEWCAGSIGSTIYLESKTIRDEVQMNDYPFRIRRLDKDDIECHIDEGWFGNITNCEDFQSDLTQ